MRSRIKINNSYYINPILNLLSFLLYLLFSQSVFGAGAGITYQGRILDPSGNPVTSTSVKFLLQIYTPGAENCLLYQEQQTKDLSTTSGVFSVTINDGTGVRQDTSGYSIDKIFANYGTFTFAAGQCAFGTTYKFLSST